MMIWRWISEPIEVPRGFYLAFLGYTLLFGVTTLVEWLV